MKNWLLRAGIISTLLAGFFLSNCKGPEPEDLQYETLVQGNTFVNGQDYEGEEPDLLIITSPQEVENPGLGVKFPPGLVRSLQAMDYQHFFAILLVNGYSLRYLNVTMDIQQVERDGNRVIIRYNFPESAADTRSSPSSNSPYHLIEVSKVGDWGEQVKFVLMRNDKTVAERTQFIP